MNLPKKIKIGFHDYKVVYPHSFGVESIDKMGLCDSNAKNLYVADELCGQEIPDSVKLQTMVHEILHGMADTSNLGLFEDDNGNPDESQIDGFAEWLCMVLHDNPEFTKLFLPKGK